MTIHAILLWHEKWIIFSLSGAMKREKINQVTKIRESIFQGQLKFILQTPSKKVLTPTTREIYTKRVTTRNNAQLRLKKSITITVCVKINLQGIFVNPSPFRKRQKVTDVKSDGLPKQEKKL